MYTPILATKLYIPRPRPNVVSRPRLLERLNEGLHRKLTLISAPAGFGKTTLVGAWVASRSGPQPPPGAGRMYQRIAGSPGQAVGVTEKVPAPLDVPDGERAGMGR